MFEELYEHMLEKRFIEPVTEALQVIEEVRDPNLSLKRMGELLWKAEQWSETSLDWKWPTQLAFLDALAGNPAVPLLMLESAEPRLWQPMTSVAYAQAKARFYTCFAEGEGPVAVMSEGLLRLVFAEAKAMMPGDWWSGIIPEKIERRQLGPSFHKLLSTIETYMLAEQRYGTVGALWGTKQVEVDTPNARAHTFATLAGFYASMTPRTESWLAAGGTFLPQGVLRLIAPFCVRRFNWMDDP